MTYNVPSPNGGIMNHASLGATPAFVILYTLVGQATGNVGDYGTPNNEQNTQLLFEAIQTLVNVKYIDITSAVVDLSVSGNRTIYGFGTQFNQASTTIYTVKFMCEQTDFLTASTLGTIIEDVTAYVPNPTTSVPITGPSTVTLSEYEVTNSTTTNTVVNVYTLLQ